MEHQPTLSTPPDPQTESHAVATKDIAAEDERTPSKISQVVRTVLRYITPGSRRRRHSTKAEDTTWNTTFLRWGPLLGLGALLFVLLSIPASAIVLAISDGQEIVLWRPEPQVYLAVFVAVGNRALAFAALQGALVTWWLKAMQGTNLQNLHRDWSVATNTWAALTAGKQSSILAATSICVVVIIADGPLLQSATFTDPKALNQEVMIPARILPEVPTNFTGFQLNDTQNMSKNFRRVLHDIVLNSPIPAPGKCDGTCRAKLTAGALALESCEEINRAPMNFTHILQLDIDDIDITHSACQLEESELIHGLWCPSLLVSTYTTKNSEFETIDVDIGMIDAEAAETCAGYFVHNRCRYRSAQAEYDAILHSDGTADVDFSNVNIRKLANNTMKNGAQHILPEWGNGSTLAGISWAMSTKFDGVVKLVMTSQNGASAKGMGTQGIGMAQMQMLYGWDNETESDPDGEGELCTTKWTDPSDKILAFGNELMFRTSAWAANLDPEVIDGALDDEIEMPITVTATRIDEQPCFKTRWSFFWAASAIQTACALLILYTYWGYWRLGREVSFSPLELAKAFDAPLLHDVNSNARSHAMARQVAGREVKYGAVPVSDQELEDDVARRLVFVESSKAYRPMNTFTFQP